MCRCLQRWFDIHLKQLIALCWLSLCCVLCLLQTAVAQDAAPLSGRLSDLSHADRQAQVALRKALFERWQGQPMKAVLTLEAALNQNATREQARLQLYLSSVLFSLGLYHEVERVLNQIDAQQQPQSVLDRVGLYRARLALRRGHEAAFFTSLDRITQSKDVLVQAGARSLSILGQLAFGSLSEAQSLFEQLPAEHPDKPLLYRAITARLYAQEPQQWPTWVLQTVDILPLAESDSAHDGKLWHQLVRSWAQISTQAQLKDTALIDPVLMDPVPPNHPLYAEYLNTQIFLLLTQDKTSQALGLVSAAPDQVAIRISALESRLAVAEALAHSGRDEAAQSLYQSLKKDVQMFRQAFESGRRSPWWPHVSEQLQQFGSDSADWSRLTLDVLQLPDQIASSTQATVAGSQPVVDPAQTRIFQWYLNDFLSLPESQGALNQWLALERMQSVVRRGERQMPVLEDVLTQRRALRSQKVSTLALADYERRFKQLSEQVKAKTALVGSGQGSLKRTDWVDDSTREQLLQVERAQARLARIVAFQPDFSGQGRAQRLLKRAQGVLQWRAYEQSLVRAPQYAASVKRSRLMVDAISQQINDLHQHARSMGDLDGLSEQLSLLNHEFLHLTRQLNHAQDNQREKLKQTENQYFSRHSMRLNTIEAHTHFGLATLADRSWQAQLVQEGRDPQEPGVPPKQLIDDYAASLTPALSPPLQARVRYRLAELEFLNVQWQEGQAEELIDFSPLLQQWQSLLADFPEHPNRPAILYRIAHLADLNANRSIAWPALEALTKDYPKAPWVTDARFRMGEYAYAEEDYARAVQEFSAVLAQPDRADFEAYTWYMLGWSHFKLEVPDRAIDAFFYLLTHLEEQTEPASKTLMTDNRLATDGLRALNILFDEHGGVPKLISQLDAFFLPLSDPALPEITLPERSTAHNWERIVFEHLEQFYLDKERLHDAIEVLDAFTARFPEDRYAQSFQIAKVDRLTQAGYLSEARVAKQTFVERYAPQTHYWKNTTPGNQEAATVLASQYLLTLAENAHAHAQNPTNTQSRQDYYNEAVQWYSQFLSLYSGHKAAAEQAYRLALCYDALDQFKPAIDAYVKAASYAPEYAQADVAAYGAVKAYESLWATELPPEQREQLREEQIQQGIAFAQRFAQHPEALAVQVQMANYRVQARLWPEAELQAEAILQAVEKGHFSSVDQSLVLAAREIYATAAFEQKLYARAETQLTLALASLNSGVSGRIELGEKHRKLWSDLLAQSIYQQGRLAVESKEILKAITHFQRVGQVVPQSPLREQADYDALTYQLSEKLWQPSIVAINAFRERYPDSKWQAGLPAKLALAYESSEQWSEAAQAYTDMAKVQQSTQLKSQAFWQAATLYEKAQQKPQAMAVYKQYIVTGQPPFDPHIEALNALATHAESVGDTKAHWTWLSQLIDLHEKRKSTQTERSTYLAAQAHMVFAQHALSRYEAVELTAPVQKSMAIKRQRMQEAVQRLQRVKAYAIAPFATQAQFALASIYQHLAVALMDSERPEGLSALELDQYELLLEEQAFPFEEQAIELHEKNLENSWAGIYDQWVQESIDALSQLMPVRYSRPEVTLEYGQHVQ